MDCTKIYTFNNSYQALTNTTLSRDPGTKLEYSNFGMGLLGQIITLQSNTLSFHELLSKWILNILDMNSIAFDLSDEQKSRLAIQHSNSSQELPTWKASKPLTPGTALDSTARDLLKFLSAIIVLMKTKLGDVKKDTQLIRHSTNHLLPNDEPAIFPSNKFDSDTLEFYTGFGWMIITNFGQEIMWHSGSTPDGYDSFIAFNPIKEREVMILCGVDASHINISNIIFKANNSLASLVGTLLTE